jgi:hypothetical protein
MAVRPNHRAPWTLEQLEELQKLADEGMPARAIARHMGRTEEAIVRMASQIRVAVKRAN